MSGWQLETSECGSVGKLTTAPAQRPQPPPFSGRPTSTLTFLTPRPHELLLTCTISQLVQDEPSRQPLMLSSQGSIVSLTPCVLCLHHFIGQILPQRVLPSAPRLEFSITSHIRDAMWRVPPWGLGQEFPPHDSFQHCQPWSLMLFVHYG